MLEVLTDVGTFISTSSFDRQKLQFVTMNELKRYMPGGLQLFPFYLVAPYSVCFLMEFEGTLNNAMFVGRWGKYIYLQWSSIFQKVDPGG